MPSGQVKTAKNQERKLAALNMRKQGMGLEEIAKALGYNSMQAVHAAIKRALEETRYEAVDEYRTINLMRLEKMINTIWPQVLDGDLKAVLVAKELLSEISKLLGLNAPVQVQTSSVGEIHVRWIDAQPASPDASTGTGAE